jgi:hypothetical protein
MDDEICASCGGVIPVRGRSYLCTPTSPIFCTCGVPEYTVPLTEDRIRQIVREEIAAAPPIAACGTYTNEECQAETIRLQDKELDARAARIRELEEALQRLTDRDFTLEAPRLAAFNAGRRYQAMKDAKVCDEIRSGNLSGDVLAAIRRAAERIGEEKWQPAPR